MRLNWSVGATTGARGALRTLAAGAVIVWMCICHLLDVGWLGVQTMFVPEYFGRYPKGANLRGYTEAFSGSTCCLAQINGVSNALRQTVFQIWLEKHLPHPSCAGFRRDIFVRITGNQ